MRIRFFSSNIMSRKVVIVGGHGKISLRLAQLLSPHYEVASVVREENQFPDIQSTGAKPLLLSLEHDDVNKFSAAFQGSYLVYFSAGAGGKGGPERTKKVDYEGAVKVFDAIEQIPGPKPRLILVSSIDVRKDPAAYPEYYNDEDKSVSEKMYKAISTYFHWKYEADKELSGRAAFDWTIVRPGGLSDELGNGRVSVGRTHIKSIPRDDVAKVLALLAERPDAKGLVLDVVGGEEDVGQALDNAIKRRVSSFSV